MSEEIWRWLRKRYKPTATADVRRIVRERDGNRCVYCRNDIRDREWHMDHRYPYSRGGRSHIGNLVTSCRDCNLRKGTALWEPVYHPPLEAHIIAWLRYLSHIRFQDFL